MTKRSVSRLYGLLLVVLAAVTIAASLVPDEAAADTVPGAAATDIVRLPRPSTTATTTTTAPVATTTTSAPGFPFPPIITTTTATSTTTTTSQAPPPVIRPIRPGLPTTTTTTTTTTEGPGPEVGPRPDTEPVFFALVNQVRADAGKEPLVLDEGLSAYARTWAEHLARTQVVEHSDFPSLIGTQWINIGENIGFGGTEEWIIDWLINSPPHYDTMTRSTYTHVGIGSWQDGRGLIWSVHVYARERVINPRPRR